MKKKNPLQLFIILLNTHANAARDILGRQRQGRYENGHLVLDDANAVEGFLVEQADGFLGAIPGGGAVLGYLDKLGKERHRKGQRGDAKVYVRTVVGRSFSDFFDILIAEDMKRQGLEPLLSFLSGRGWLTWAGSRLAKERAAYLLNDSDRLAAWAERNGPAEGLHGEAANAIGIYQVKAYPVSVLNPTPPREILESDDWALLVSLVSDFEASHSQKVGGIAYLSEHSVPKSAAGLSVIRSRYSAEIGYLEGNGLSLRPAPSARREERKPPKKSTDFPYPTWKSKKFPKGLATRNKKTGKPFQISPEGWGAMSTAARIAKLKELGMSEFYAQADGEEAYRASKKGGGKTGLLLGAGVLVIVLTTVAVKSNKEEG